MKFSEKINELMLLKGISNEAQLATCVGISQSTLNRLLAGRTENPNQEVLKKIARFFDVEVDALLIEKEIVNLYILEKERYHHSPSEVLRYLMQDIGDISEGELSRRTGIPQPTIHRILSGKTPNPRLDSVKPLADFFNVSIDQMLARNSLPKDRIPGTFVTDIVKQKSIPVLTWEEVINWPDILKRPEFKLNRSWIMSDLQVDSLSFAFQINDVHFAPEFKKGTWLIIDPTRPMQEGLFLIASHLGQTIIGQITTDSNDEFVLFGVCPGSIEIPLNQCRCFGVIVEAKKIYQ